MKITLNNIADLDSLIVDKPKTFKETYSNGEIRNSFKDSGVQGFKEITDISKISFGHFIVIEKILQIEADENEKMKMIAQYILRPEGEAMLDNDDAEKEAKHASKVLELPIGSVYAAFTRFIEKRNQYLFKDFNGVIYGTLDADDEIKDDDDDKDSKSTDSSVSAREFYNKKFFWYNLIGTVAGGDIFKRQLPIELPMYEVMPFLAEKRNLAIVENLEAKARR